jgi:exosortase/archaeosortase family protein
MKKKAHYRFILSFGLLFGAYYIAMTFGAFREFLTNFAAFNTSISKFIMNIFGINANVHGNILFNNSGSIEVGIGCDGSEPILVLLAGIIASKASYLSKSLGLIIGSIMLLLFNSARIIGLFYVNKYNKDNFNIFHNDIMPLALMVFSILIFIFWNYKFAKK